MAGQQGTARWALVRSALRALTSAIFLLGFLAACGGPPPTEAEVAAEDRQSRFAQMMRYARTHYDGGDYATSVIYFQRAAGADPTSPDPLAGLAEASEQLGGFEEAGAAYGRAVELAPKDAELRLKLGRVLLVLEQAREAADQYAAAANLAPRDHRAHNGLGVAMDLLGDFEAAQRHFIDGLEITPDDVTLRNNLALSLILKGAYDEAIAVLAELARDPRASPRNRLNLALAHGLAGDAEQAAAVSRQDLDEASIQKNLESYRHLRTLPPAERAAVILRQYGETGGKPE